MKERPFEVLREAAILHLDEVDLDKTPIKRLFIEVECSNCKDLDIGGSPCPVCGYGPEDAFGTVLVQMFPTEFSEKLKETIDLVLAAEVIDA